MEEELKFIPLVQAMLDCIEQQEQGNYYQIEEPSYFILGSLTKQQLNDVRTFLTSFEGVYEGETA